MLLNYKWLIIGGGIHGVHLAARLIADAKIPAQEVAIVDPGPTLLHKWRSLTAVTGMRHLRSPSVHHLDVDPWSLRRFAGKAKTRPPGLFAPPYDRPALTLFNQHCKAVIDAHDLRECHIRARAVECNLVDGQVQVTLHTQEILTSNRAVLAMGVSEQPYYPEWVPAISEGLPVSHIFDPAAAKVPRDPARIAVVGGGISAAQVALGLTQSGHRVELVCRHPLREHQFDSDPGWLGPKHMGAFSKERCMQRRRAMIVQARHRGSVPKDVHRALRRAITQGDLRFHQAQVQRVDARRGSLVLASGDMLGVDQIYLATGFAGRRPGGAMIDALVEREKLPCAPCGFPIVGKDLAWGPGLHVTGPFAELELGPTSRNIAGARRAGDRLVKVAQGALPQRRAG